MLAGFWGRFRKGHFSAPARVLSPRSRTRTTRVSFFFLYGSGLVFFSTLEFPLVFFSQHSNIGGQEMGPPMLQKGLEPGRWDNKKANQLGFLVPVGKKT
jgi:hypothetical protein